jgi:hypothetical protein
MITNPRWPIRHAQAMAAPRPGEYGLVHMITGWVDYADVYVERYDAPIGEDHVLGPAWQAIGEGLRTLLNGETGRLDCGSLDRLILDTMVVNGCEVER